jgi:hypothetical protein
MNSTTNNTGCYTANTDTILRFASLADITTEQDTLSGIEHFVGQAPIKEVLHLPTDGNVRGYLAESNPKRMTHVHREIYRFSLSIQGCTAKDISCCAGFKI